MFQFLSTFVTVTLEPVSSLRCGTRTFGVSQQFNVFLIEHLFGERDLFAGIYEWAN